MFDPDRWLRQQGPGAVSAYCSIAIQLVCVGLSALGPTDLQGPNLRLSAAKSRDRMAKLGIKSKRVDRFLTPLRAISSS
jgi:hypothetical protein